MDNLLDLPGWRVTDTHSAAGQYLIEAEYTIQPHACTRCSAAGTLYRHGTKLVNYIDIPMRGQPTRLVARVQRYKCRKCTETFLQPLAGILADRRVTDRCSTYIAYRCLSHTFTHIAEDVGCDDKTIRTLDGEFIAALGAKYQPQLPEWLGIDETLIAGQRRCILTDVGNGQTIDILRDRSKAAVADWLARYQDRGAVKCVTTGMWLPWRELTHLMLPGVPLVVDKLHVMMMANYCMERVRTRLRKARKANARRGWLKSTHTPNMASAELGGKQCLTRDETLYDEPELAVASQLKETLSNIYEMDKNDAATVLDGFTATVPPEFKHDFNVLVMALEHWRAEILAFFDYPVMNTYTEALTQVGSEIARAGRGYSFEVARARLLFGNQVKDKTWSITSHTYSSAKTISAYIRASDNRCQCCGVKFSRERATSRRIAQLSRGDEKTHAVLCMQCLTWFHKEGLAGEEPASTYANTAQGPTHMSGKPM